jgi:signal transduction histidine kinase
VLVDGQIQQLQPPDQSDSSENAPADVSARAGRLQISSRAQRLELRFGPANTPSNPPVRLRYQLEGIDKEWREPGGEMRLTVKFLDSANNTASAVDFVARGESPGWAGNVLDSRFVHRREQLIVPPRSAWIQIELFSGGDEQTTGIMAIDALSVSFVGTTNAKPDVLLFNSRPDEGRDHANSLGVPRHWMRDGSKPAIAQLLSSHDNEPRYALAVIDTDATKWGAWRTDPDSSLPVSPGDSIVLAWNEMFSIGWGGTGLATYSYLPPGKYVFSVRPATESGAWSAPATSVAITVQPPFWKTTWFLGGTLALAIGGLLTIVRYATWRKMKSQIEALDRQSALERERARIARDLHDDLGASLTQIALLSELAKADLGQPELARTHLDQIFKTVGVLARELNEIVWAVNPANDTLEHFTNHICKFAQDYLSLAGIRCRLDFPESVPSYAMPSAERHSLFLAAREALHNIVKHAEAGQVWVRLKLPTGFLMLLIEDDGKGLDSDTLAAASAAVTGNGLSNMQKRMEQLGGRFTQQSNPGRGTSVRLELPLRKP